MRAQLLSTWSQKPGGRLGTDCTGVQAKEIIPLWPIPEKHCLSLSTKLLWKQSPALGILPLAQEKPVELQRCHHGHVLALSLPTPAMLVTEHRTLLMCVGQSRGPCAPLWHCQGNEHLPLQFRRSPGSNSCDCHLRKDPLKHFT